MLSPGDGLLRGLRRGQFFAMNQQAHLIEGGGQAACIVIRAKAWLHGAVDDARCLNIGDGPFKLASHLDTHASVVLGHHDERAVANVLAPQLPAAGHAPGIGGNVFRRGGGHHEDDHLRARVVFQLFELVAQHLHIRRAERARLIHDPLCQRGHGLQLLGESGQRSQQRDPCKNKSYKRL